MFCFSLRKRSKLKLVTNFSGFSRGSGWEDSQKLRGLTPYILHCRFLSSSSSPQSAASAFILLCESWEVEENPMRWGRESWKDEEVKRKKDSPFAKSITNIFRIMNQARFLKTLNWIYMCPSLPLASFHLFRVTFSGFFSFFRLFCFFSLLPLSYRLPHSIWGLEILLCEKCIKFYSST